MAIRTTVQRYCVVLPVTEILAVQIVSPHWAAAELQLSVELMTSWVASDDANRYATQGLTCSTTNTV